MNCIVKSVISFLCHCTIKEHLYGRQHLQAITGEIHRELAPRLQGVENGDCQSVGEGFSDDSYNGCSSSGKTADISLHKNWVSNVNQAIIDFMNVTHAREKEIVVLSQHLENVKHTNLEFQQKLEELKKMMETAHRSLQDLKTEGTFLSTQLDQLRMVPALFGVINF
ncbi:uncharacterized protein LOC143239389 [Tachypleus tridentatus]|uniref:uncharacterized protein LOC143239389 n=1 Tax=Tachypleus tridentatus TaxID=6853 RepID=UPI003FD625BC